MVFFLVFFSFRRHLLKLSPSSKKILLYEMQRLFSFLLSSQVSFQLPLQYNRITSLKSHHSCILELPLLFLPRKLELSPLFLLCILELPPLLLPLIQELSTLFCILELPSFLFVYFFIYIINLPTVTDY